MPNIKCKICGTEFPALVERHYIARDLTKTGLAAAFGSSDEPAMFDAFDCSLKPGRWFISFPAVTNIPIKEGS